MKTGKKTLNLLLILALLASVTPAQGENAKYHDWPSYRGPNHNGVSEEAGWVAKFPEEGPDILWKTKLGAGYSAVAVVGESVYAMGHIGGEDIVYRFDAETGEELARFSYSAALHDNMHAGGPSGTPAVDESGVYTFSKEGRVYCLDPTTLAVSWTRDLKKTLGVEVPTWGFSGSPTVNNQLVFIDAGVIIAFDKVTSAIVWKTKDYGAGYSTPVPFIFNRTKCLAAFPAYGLVILNRETGEQLGKYRWETDYSVNAAVPLIDRERVLISSGYGVGAGLFELKKGGKPGLVWKSDKLRTHMNTSLLVEGYLYGFDEGTLTCLDFESGQSKWAERGLGKGSLTAADGKLIILSEKGELVIAQTSGEEFKEISRGQVLGGRCWTAPVIAGHRIYCRNDKGDLVCVDVRMGEK